MSNKELHLFIFEGEKTEISFLYSLESKFMGSRNAIKCVFGAEIYQLFKLMKKDVDLDIVGILKERNPENAETLKGCNQDSFAGIYLFFDYDAHSPKADDTKIKKMLNFFDNETENGLLYLSYPMAEALRHYKDNETFKDLLAKCKGGNKLSTINCPNKNSCPEIENCKKEPHYKEIVQNDCRSQLTNMNKYDKQIWKELIEAHVCKMNYLVNDTYTLPTKTETQSTIFDKQLEKHINRFCPQVAVLSAFPIYILDYYGTEKLKQKLKE